MIKIQCDRCKKEIKGTTYYTVNIYAEDIEPKSSTISYATAVQNTSTNLISLLNIQKMYCEECKIKIENFMQEEQ